MRIAIDVLAGWVVLSCTVGPVLTWLFYWGERRDREAVGQRAPKAPSSTWRLATAVVVLVLVAGSLGAVLLRNGAAADADIVDMRRP
jgi:hypothetical protein